jgi:2C-methyl-D-erythritol 2,4-cyclodiphosphate synthase
MPTFYYMPFAMRFFGAACPGDIGSHFPDTDAAYKNIDSKILLQKQLT